MLRPLPAPPTVAPVMRMRATPRRSVVDLAAVLGSSVPLQAAAVTVGKGPLTLPEATAYVVAGGAILSRLAVGCRVSTQLLGPGDVLLADAMASAEPFVRESRALIRSTIATVDLPVLVRRAPGLLPTMIESSARSAQSLAEQHVVGQLVDIESRVAALLPRLAEDWGVVSGQGILLPAFLSHTVMAELLSVRRPSFTSAVPRLEAEGLLQRLDDGRWLLGEALTPGKAP